MTRKTPPKAPVSMLWLLLAGAAALAVLWWVGRNFPKAVYVLTPLLAIAVMGFSVFLARRHGRHMDEVQVASQRAASYHGTLYGTLLAMTLMSVPQVMNWLSTLVNTLSHNPVDAASRRAVILGFFFGACLVAVMQTLVSTLTVCLWWRRAVREQPQ